MQICRNDKNEYDLELKIFGTQVSLRLQTVKSILGVSLRSARAFQGHFACLCTFLRL